MLQIHISNFFPLFRETETNGFLKRSRFRFRFWIKTEIRFGFSVYRTALIRTCKTLNSGVRQSGDYVMGKLPALAAIPSPFAR